MPINEHHFDFHVHPFRKLKRELREFYAFIAIEAFAISLIGVFEPIYIFLFFGQSFFHTFLYFGLMYLVFALFAPLSAKLVSRVGIKHTLLIATPFLFGYYTGLWQIDNLGNFVFFLPILSGLEKAIFWPAYHMFFTRITDYQSRGKQIGYQMIILSTVAGIAPFVGGLIIVGYGFPLLFAIVLSLLFASFIPLFLSQDLKENFRDPYGFMLKKLFSKEYRKKNIAFVSFGGEFVINTYVWPLFLFLLAISFDSLGLITSGSLLLGMVFSFYIGKTADKVGPDKLLAGGAVLNALFWPIKIFVRTPWEAFLAHGMHKFGRFSAHIPFDSIFYRWAGESDVARERFVLLREIVISLSRAVILFILAFLVKDIMHLVYLFLFGAIFSLGYLAAVKDPKAIFKNAFVSKK